MNLSKQLEAIAKNIGVRFTFKGQPIAFAEVFSDTGLLPGLSKRADQLAQLALGYGLGTTYEDHEHGILGNKVIFDEFTPDLLRIFCIIDVLFEIVKLSPKEGAIALDELTYD